jgi:hypothetical protein
MSVSRILAIAGFTVAAVLFIVVEFLARRPKSNIPTMGAFTSFVMRYQVGALGVGRIAVVGFWWWIGWHFFAR